MERVSRNCRIYLRVTQDEQNIIREQAELSGLSIAEYARKRVLGFRIMPKSELNILRELRRLGGLVKYLHNESQGLYSSETAEALNALTSYAHALERELSYQAGGG